MPEPLPSVRRNLAWHYGGHVFEAAVGVVLLGYVLRHVAVEAYGVFLLALSIASTLLLLDLGLTSILVPAYVSERARGGDPAAARLLSTVFLVLGGLGVAGLIVCAALASALPGPFRVPAALLGDARVLVVLAGFLVLANLPAMAIESMYKAVHRFELLNQLQLACTVLRVIATVAVLHAGYGVLGLMVVTVGHGLLRIAALAAFLPRVADDLRLSLAVDWAALRPLVAPAGWAMLENTGRQLAIPSGALLLAMFGSMESVAVFGVGSRIPQQLWALVNRGTGVALPLIAARHAHGDVRGLQDVFTSTLRVALRLPLPLLVFLAAFAEPLVEVWAGPGYRDAAAVLRWLLLTTVGVGLSAPSYALLYGTGQVKTAARIALGETAAYLVAALPLASRFDGAGLAAASAASHLLATTLFYFPRAARTARVRGLAVTGVASAQVLARGALVAVTALVLAAMTVHLAPLARVVAAATAGLAIYAGIWARAGLLGTPEVVTGGDVG